MRTPAEPEVWNHVMKWLIPGQILRGVLMAAVWYPFLDAFKQWGFLKRFASIAGLYLC